MSSFPEAPYELYLRRPSPQGAIAVPHHDQRDRSEPEHYRVDSTAYETRFGGSEWEYDEKTRLTKSGEGGCHLPCCRP